MKRKLILIGLLATGVAAALSAYLLVGREARVVDVIALFATAMGFGVTLLMAVRDITKPS